MKKIILISNLLLVATFAQANDTYLLTYSKDKNCTLAKNAKKIALFDERFKQKAPHSSYTCSAIQKEQYNDCKVVNKKNITAEFFGYGAYGYTNLIMAFQNPSPSVKSSLKVICTKDLHLK